MIQTIDPQFAPIVEHITQSIPLGNVIYQLPEFTTDSVRGTISQAMSVEGSVLTEQQKAEVLARVDEKSPALILMVQEVLDYLGELSAA